MSLNKNQYDSFDKRLTDNNVSGAYNLDVSKYDVFDLTLTAATDFTIINMPTGTDAKTFSVYLTGASAWTLSQATEETSSDPYDGAGRNRVQVDIINGTPASEDITYQIHNL